MIHNYNSLPPIDPEHSVRLDVHTWSEHKEVNALRDAVWKEIPTQLQDALLGKSNNKGTPPPAHPKSIADPPIRDLAGRPNPLYRRCT